MRLRIALACLFFTSAAWSTTTQEAVYHTFGCPTGCAPYAPPIIGADGNLYGTASQGGAEWVAGGPATGKNGVVYKVTVATGTYTVLHDFTINTDGQWPLGALVQGSDGTLYGTTALGGPNDLSNGGDGTLFKITPTGTYTLLHSFGADATDGKTPLESLAFGSDGNLYGTTPYGGANGGGTFFKITPSGTYTLLYSFGTFATDGTVASSTPTLGSDGNFYGVTAKGGAFGKGTFYRMSLSGVETVLYSFGACSIDAAGPGSAVIEHSDGNFYGVADGGATNKGAVFVVTPAGVETVIHSFDAGGTSGLMLGKDGNFYGTTYYGGDPNGDGTAYVVGPDGTFSQIYQFGATSSDVVGPGGGMVQASDGTIYGVSQGGGPNASEGWIFTLKVSGTSAPQFPTQITTACPAPGATTTAPGASGTKSGALDLGALLCLLLAVVIRVVAPAVRLRKQSFALG